MLELGIAVARVTAKALHLAVARVAVLNLLAASRDLRKLVVKTKHLVKKKLVRKRKKQLQDIVETNS